MNYRNPSISRLLTSSTLIGVSLLAAPAFAQSDANGGLSDIIVTAQKVEQNLQQVPVAVTAISAETIEQRQIQGFSDLSGVAPGVVMNPGGSGSGPSPRIRGIGGGNIASGVDVGVALYIDNVYQARTVGLGFEAADIERIEVLRGPQGTLFGRNATGGAINIITAGPKGEWAVRQEAMVANRDRFRTKTRLDLPEWNGLSIALSYMHDQQDGYVRNSQGGVRWNFEDVTRGLVKGTRTSARSLGANNVDSGQVAIRYEPESLPLKVDYRFNIVDRKSTLPGNQVLAAGFGSLFYGVQPPGNGKISLARLSSVPNNYSTPEYLRTWSHSLTLSLDVSDQLQLKSISGIRHYKDSFSNNIAGDGSMIDNAGTSAIVAGFGFAPTPGAGAPFTLGSIIQFEESDQYSQEFQAILKTDPVDLIAGLYYFQEKTLSVSPYIGYSDLSPPNPATATNVLSITDSDANNRSYAAFAQATVHLNDKLDLIGGIRYTKDKRETTAGPISTLSVDFAKTFKKWTWLANVTYRPTDDLTLYAKASTGFLSGGVFNGNVFDPETVTSYELGVKSDFLDNRVRLNVAAFYMDYQDQITGLVNPQQIFIYDNVGSSSITGVEIELLAKPVPELTLGANWGYSHYKIKEFILNGNDRTNDFAFGGGQSPEHTVQLSADYEFPEILGGVKPVFHANADWTSKFARIAFPGNWPQNVQNTLYGSNFWDVDARLTLSDIAFGNTATGKFSLWAENLLNKKKIAFANDLSSVLVGAFTEPRRYGLDFSIEF